MTAMPISDHTFIERPGRGQICSCGRAGWEHDFAVDPRLMIWGSPRRHRRWSGLVIVSGTMFAAALMPSEWVGWCVLGGAAWLVAHLVEINQ